MRRWPILPTLVVLVAAGIMVRLGFWQLDRLHEKEAMLAGFIAAQGNPALADWNGVGPAPDRLTYRRVRVDCGTAIADHPVSGRNAAGQAGWVQMAGCSRAPLRIALGWSGTPGYVPGAPDDARLPQRWAGGVVTGWLAPGGRLVADPPLAGLQPNARPDPRDLPNNHLAYAVQWFAFAAVALVIYGLAVRKRV